MARSTMLIVAAIAYSIIAPLVTGFAAIGIFLFYFAFRYNILYVYDTNADTKGLLYPRALQQLFVGLYIAQICIIGLLAVALPRGKGAIGPFVLMILLLIFTALYHVSLNAALSPLLKYLPKTLHAEEMRAANAENAVYQNGKEGQEEGKESAELAETPVTAPRHPKPNMLAKFLKPHIYNDYATMRRLVPEHVTPHDEVDDSLISVAYLPPSVWNEVPRLIVPRDAGGVSGHEVVESGRIVPITDAGATLNEKNKIVVDDTKMGELFFLEKQQRMKYEH
jgi:calcium permeable stress-gated cation channel